MVTGPSQIGAAFGVAVTCQRACRCAAREPNEPRASARHEADSRGRPFESLAARNSQLQFKLRISVRDPMPPPLAGFALQAGGRLPTRSVAAVRKIKSPPA